MVITFKAVKTTGCVIVRYFVHLYCYAVVMVSCMYHIREAAEVVHLKALDNITLER
jgi:hypothetical protein